MSPAPFEPVTLNERAAGGGVGFAAAAGQILSLSSETVVRPAGSGEGFR
jgi:hypothetical protein